MKRWIGRLVARVDVRVAGRGFRPVLRLGAFAVGIRWNQANTVAGKIVYPDYFSAQAAGWRINMDTERSLFLTGSSTARSVR